MTRTRLIIFDMDGTLIDRAGKLLPGVKAWWDAYSHTIHVAIATNQGGVGLRYWMELEGFGDPSTLPTEADVQSTIAGLLQQLGRNSQKIIVLKCFRYQSKTSGKWSPRINESAVWNESWRKPAPGMLLAAMRLTGISTDQTLMVGDSEEDLLAAHAAGCAFQRASVFFAPFREDERDG